MEASAERVATAVEWTAVEEIMLASIFVGVGRCYMGVGLCCRCYERAVYECRYVVFF